MENGVLMQNNSVTMGATSNSNSARLAALQDRKKSIEESLSIKEKALRELCLQEADLTGIIPSEMPLQPGESPPNIRRKVGTSYMLPENLLKFTNKGESIADLELQLQLHANMAEAALGLAHKQNLSKTVRRQHKSEYQHHKREYKILQEKIALLKDTQSVLQPEQTLINEQQKQKKKPRPLVDQDDSVSVISNDPFRKSEQRQSIRSMRHTLQSDNLSDLYPQFHQRMPTRSVEVPCEIGQHKRFDDLSSPFYKLNLSGYKQYIERRESYAPMQMYHPKPANYQHVHGTSTYPSAQFQYNNTSYVPIQQSSPVLFHGPVSPQSSTISQHNHMPQNSPSGSDMSTLYNAKYNNSRYYQNPVNSVQYQNYGKYTNSNPIPISRQSSPNLNGNVGKYQYSNSPAASQHSYMYKNGSVDGGTVGFQNPHQLQPHQQYEQNTGLGGCWKKKESGEIIWCNNSSSIDPNSQRDRRFGSLDRRKNRRIQKRVSPNGDNKSATLATMSHSSDQKKPVNVMHSPQVQTRHSQDRQLVRTQSLGSVGVQTSDSVWPSDDNSSCDSESRIIHERSNTTLRRQKQRDWIETSLDSSKSPVPSVVSRCQSTVPPVLAPEEKYVSNSCTPPPILTKPPLEIPAESNPSPRLPEANMELFNNNIHSIPKNCTIVQAGHCKPYHEETKPFEMSDFYKYSTKFKKSPSKTATTNDQMSFDRSSRNLRDHYETKSIYHHHNHQNNLPSHGSGSGQTDHLNNSLEYNEISSNQDPYMSDKTLWYSPQPPGEQENNNATLV